LSEIETMAMPSNTPTKRHLTSSLQYARSPDAKRRRIEYEKPRLSVDCTVSPRSTPQLMTYLSPVPFQFDPRFSYNGVIQHSTGFSQHHPQLQQSAACYSWGQYTAGARSQWIDPSLPYDANANNDFVGTCTTSVASSYSVFSSISTTQDPFKDPPEVTGLSPQLPAAETRIARDRFIANTVTSLRSLREVLTTEEKVVEELLEAAALILGRKSNDTSSA
jgi:hypothetical protein